MNKTLTRVTVTAAVLLAAGSAFAQQAGGGPPAQTQSAAPKTQGGMQGAQGTNTPGSPGTQSGMQQQTPGGMGQGNNATSTEKK